MQQIDQLVALKGADTLDAETLAGVLLDAIRLKEAWHAKGAAFFRRRGRKGGDSATIDGSALRLNRAAMLRAEAAERLAVRRLCGADGEQRLAQEHLRLWRNSDRHSVPAGWRSPVPGWQFNRRVPTGETIYLAPPASATGQTCGS